MIQNAIVFLRRICRRIITAMLRLDLRYRDRNDNNHDQRIRRLAASGHPSLIERCRYHDWGQRDVQLEEHALPSSSGTIEIGSESSRNLDSVTITNICCSTRTRSRLGLCRHSSYSLRVISSYFNRHHRPKILLLLILMTLAVVVLFIYHRHLQVEVLRQMNRFESLSKGAEDFNLNVSQSNNRKTPSQAWVNDSEIYNILSESHCHGGGFLDSWLSSATASLLNHPCHWRFSSTSSGTTSIISQRMKLNKRNNDESLYESQVDKPDPLEEGHEAEIQQPENIVPMGKKTPATTKRMIASIIHLLLQDLIQYMDNSGVEEIEKGHRMDWIQNKKDHLEMAFLDLMICPRAAASVIMRWKEINNKRNTGEFLGRPFGTFEFISNENSNVLLPFASARTATTLLLTWGRDDHRFQGNGWWNDANTIEALLDYFALCFNNNSALDDDGSDSGLNHEESTTFRSSNATVTGCRSSPGPSISSKSISTRSRSPPSYSRSSILISSLPVEKKMANNFNENFLNTWSIVKMNLDSLLFMFDKREQHHGKLNVSKICPDHVQKESRSNRLYHHREYKNGLGRKIDIKKVNSLSSRKSPAATISEEIGACLQIVADEFSHMIVPLFESTKVLKMVHNSNDDNNDNKNDGNSDKNNDTKCDENDDYKDNGIRSVGEWITAHLLRTFFERQSISALIRSKSHDDIGWWILTWLRAWEVTSDPSYRDRAARLHSYLVQHAWTNDTCGGGLTWEGKSIFSKEYKNAITNELFVTATARMALAFEKKPMVTRITGAGVRTNTYHSHNDGVDNHHDSNHRCNSAILNDLPLIEDPEYYWAWSLHAWRWFESSGMINEKYQINDGLDSKCRNANFTIYTYNQGVILGGLALLAAHYNNISLVHIAENIIRTNLNLNRMPYQSSSSQSGIFLQEECEFDENIHRCRPDERQFKGIFIRYVGRFYEWINHVDSRSTVMIDQELAQSARVIIFQMGTSLWSKMRWVRSSLQSQCSPSSVTPSQASVIKRVWHWFKELWQGVLMFLTVDRSEMRNDRIMARLQPILPKMEWMAAFGMRWTDLSPSRSRFLNVDASKDIDNVTFSHRDAQDFADCISQTSALDLFNVAAQQPQRGLKS